MGKVELDLGSDDSNDGGELTINKSYAENYEKWRRNEILQQLKDKYKNRIPDDDEEDESSSESEPEWTVEDEKSFFRTLGALKTNDPNIYDKNTRFFKEKTDNEETTSKPKKQKQEKGMTLRDYEVALVTEKEGHFDDEDDEEKLKSEGYHEKSARLKEEFKKAIESEEESDDSGEFLMKKTKTQAEKQKEEEDFAEWLKGEGKDLNLDPEDGIVKLKSKWSEPLDEGEAFLRDYFLDKKYEVDDDDQDPLKDYDGMIEIEKEFDKADDFEKRYNFRFEEPDQDFIKQFPRTVKESIRKAPEKRKEKREERKKRKEEEKKQQKEEIKLMKSLKKKEIEDKLKKLREIAGDDSLPITLEELEKEFDPKEYDERMKELFTDDYYENTNDVEKPVFSDLSDDEELSDYDNMPIESRSDEVGQDQAEDAEDYQEEKGESNNREKISSRRKKRNSKFREMVAKQKPLFNPKEKTFEEYLNDYYALDYEDILPGNVVTKFKYRNVPANDFGLTTEEILAADDKQLNQWASVKKASQYRSEQEEEYDKRAYSKKAKNPAIKSKIFGKKKEPQGDNKKESNKKPKQNNNVVENGQAEETQIQGKKKNRRKNKNKSQKKKAAMIMASTGVDIDRLKAYNVSNKAIKRKIFGNQKHSSAAKKQKTE